MHRFLASTILFTLLLALVWILPGCDTPVIDIGGGPVRVVNEEEGTGARARAGQLVTIDYTVSLPDGSHVLTDRGYQFELGRNAVIECIDSSVVGMRVGGMRVIECPPHRHWGRKGYGDGVIPENTTLTIEMRLVRARSNAR